MLFLKVRAHNKGPTITLLDLIYETVHQAAKYSRTRAWYRRMTVHHLRCGCGPDQRTAGLPRLGRRARPQLRTLKSVGFHGLNVFGSFGSRNRWFGSRLQEVVRWTHPLPITPHLDKRIRDSNGWLYWSYPKSSWV